MRSDLRSLSPSSLVSSALSHASPRRRNLPDLESEAGALTRAASPAIAESSNVPDDVFTGSPKPTLTRKQKANQKKHQQAHKRARLKIIRKILTQGYRKSQVEFLLTRAQLRALSQQNALGLEGVVQPETQEAISAIVRPEIVPGRAARTREQPIKTSKTKKKRKRKKIAPHRIPLPPSIPTTSKATSPRLPQADSLVVSPEKVRNSASTPVLPELESFSPHGELLPTSPFIASEKGMSRVSTPQSAPSRISSPLGMLPLLQFDAPVTSSKEIGHILSPSPRSANSPLSELILPHSTSPSVLSEQLISRTSTPVLPELRGGARSTSPEMLPANTHSGTPGSNAPIASTSNVNLPDDAPAVSDKRALKAQNHERRTQEAITAFLERDALKTQKQLDAITVKIAELAAKKLNLDSLLATEARQQAIANIRIATNKIREDIARLEAEKLDKRSQSIALLQMATSERFDALKQADLVQRDRSITLLKNATNERQAKVQEEKTQARLQSIDKTLAYLKNLQEDLQVSERHRLQELSLRKPALQTRKQSLDTVSSRSDTTSVKTEDSQSLNKSPLIIVQEPEGDLPFAHSPSRHSVSGSHISEALSPLALEMELSSHGGFKLNHRIGSSGSLASSFITDPSFENPISFANDLKALDKGKDSMPVRVTEWLNGFNKDVKIQDRPAENELIDWPSAPASSDEKTNPFSGNPSEYSYYNFSKEPFIKQESPLLSDFITNPSDIGKSSPLPGITITKPTEEVDPAYAGFNETPSLSALLNSRIEGTGTRKPTPVATPQLAKTQSLPTILANDFATRPVNNAEGASGTDGANSELAIHDALPKSVEMLQLPSKLRSRKALFTIGTPENTSPAASSFVKLPGTQLGTPASPFATNVSLPNAQLLQVPPSPAPYKPDWAASARPSQSSLPSLDSFLTPQEKIRWEENKLKAAQILPEELPIIPPQPEVAAQFNRTVGLQSVRRSSQLDPTNPFAQALEQARGAGNSSARYSNRLLDQRGNRATLAKNWRDLNRVR